MSTSSQENKLHDVVRGVMAGVVFGPLKHCYICGRGLEDSESIKRGIGPECWVDVLKWIRAKEPGGK